MRRINVIGTSCSGKSTLARALAARLGLPVVELDALFWGPRWTPVPHETFTSRVEAAAGEDTWVIDGSYSVIREITWGRADTIVWLDYPMPLVLGRWLRRTLVRIRSGEEFWPATGNRETIHNALKRGGLLWWILRTHRSRRRRTLAALAERPDLRVVRLRSPSATARWLDGVQRSTTASTTAGASASAQKP